MRTVANLSEVPLNETAESTLKLVLNITTAKLKEISSNPHSGNPALRSSSKLT
jgi:hypothetical protein